MFGKGVSKVGELIDYGVKLDIVDKSGAWFSYGDTKLGQGRENAKIYLENNPDVADEILNKIKEQMGDGVNLMSTSDDENKGEE